MRAFILLFFCAALLPFSVSAVDEERPLWEQEAMLLYSPSSSQFTELRSLANWDPRMARFTRAVEALHEKADLEREQYELVLGMFKILVADKDDDAIGLASQYYTARIMQSHPMEQDLQTAKKLYFDLFDSYSDRFFGQMAFFKYATIEIYDDSVEGKTPLNRIQNLEQYVTSMTVGEMKRNFHRVMGEAYASFELDPESAYSHLNTAYEMRLPVESMRIDVLVRLGELGEVLGDVEKALKAYDELLLIAPYHDRRDEFMESAQRLRGQL